MRIPKVFWVFVLIFSIGVFAYEGYMIYWRVSFCDFMNRFESIVPPSDTSNYLNRKIAHKEICQDYSNIVPIILGGIGVSWVINKLRSKPLTK